MRCYCWIARPPCGRCYTYPLVRRVAGPYTQAHLQCTVADMLPFGPCCSCAPPCSRSQHAAHQYRLGCIQPSYPVARGKRPTSGAASVHNSMCCSGARPGFKDLVMCLLHARQTNQIFVAWANISAPTGRQPSLCLANIKGVRLLTLDRNPCRAPAKCYHKRSVLLIFQDNTGAITSARVRQGAVLQM